MGAVRFAFEGTHLVIVMGAGDPDRTDWEAMVQAIDERLSRRSAVVGVLVVHLGEGAPTALQRASLHSVLRKHAWRGPIGVVVESAIARAVVSILGATNGFYRSFSPREMSEVLSYIHATAFGPVIRGCLQRLQAQVLSGG